MPAPHAVLAPLQLRSASSPHHFIDLSAECGRVDEIVFTAVYYRWTEAGYVVDERQSIHAVDFGVWWQNRMREEWRANWRKKTSPLV